VLMNEGANIGTTSHGRSRVVDLVAHAVESGRIEDGVVREKLGAGYVEERVLELLQERLTRAILDGRRPDVDGSVLKVFSAESGHRKAELAAWLQGADGLLAGPSAPMQGLWQDQLLGRGAVTIGGGTVEVHRNGLGERALGLPKEPRVDRDRPFKDLRVSGA